MIGLLAGGWKFIVGAFIAALVVWPAGKAIGKLQGGAGAKAQCQAEALQAQLAETTRQRDAERAIRQNEQARVSQLETQVASMKEQNDAFAIELAARADRCPLSDADVDRLRNIWRGG